MKKVNENFFSEPNLLNSYWAGFIAADGSIQDKNNKLCIELSLKELYHLENFKKHIESEHKIGQRTRTILIKQNKNPIIIVSTCSIQIGNPKLIKDLKDNFKITGKKSNREKFPTLSKENLKSFIIGYIDGDGSIMKVKNRPNSLKLQILVSKELLTNIKKFFEKEYNFYSDKGIHKYQKGNIHSYVLNGTAFIFILKELSLIAVPKLERKWNKIWQ